MKKLFFACLLLIIYGLFFASPLYAACIPPTDYSSCPELNPDLNLDHRGYEPIAGNLDLMGFDHPIDTRAPQLSSLLQGNPTPSISSLYQIYDWDWSRGSRGDLIQRPADAPNDFATLAGFSTQTGQGILVPNSGYDIGGGYEAVVLYADPNSITLKYTAEDTVATGYTIHLENFRVNPQLIAYYNQLNQGGREQLPALLAGEKIGEAMGAEILVAIRDTGSFMDPRWINDWWQTLDPAILLELILRGILLMPSIQGYGPCNSETPGDEGAGISWGDSFEAKVSDLPWAPAEEKLVMTLRGLEFDFPQNEKLAYDLESSNEKLTPIAYSPSISQKTAMGEIWYEVCDLASQETFEVTGDPPNQLSFDTPSWMDFTSSLGTSLRNLFISRGGGGGYTQETRAPQVAGEQTSLAQAQACSADKPYEIVPSCGQCGDQLFCWGNHCRRCETDPRIPGYGPGCPDANPNNSWEFAASDFPSGRLLYNSVEFSVPSGGVYLCDSNVTGCNNECFDALPARPRSFCKPYIAQGGNQPSEEICIGGFCQQEIPAASFIQRITDELGRIIEVFLPSKTFLVTPVIKTPHGQNIDNTLRSNVFRTFLPAAVDSPFKHTLTPALHEVSGSSEDYDSDSEVYGQKGVEDIKKQSEQIITPSALLSL